MGWIKAHWGMITSTIAAAFICLGMAYKAFAWQMNQDFAIENDRDRIETIEEAIKVQTQQMERLRKVEARQERFDERNQMILEIIKSMDAKL